MIISVINHASSKISDEEAQSAIRVINRQIAQDFEPYWSMGAEIRLEGKSSNQPSKTNVADMRGEAIIYLWDKFDIDNALGYHDRNFKGIPYGFVFTELADRLGEKWTVTFSHEALETIADPEVNLLVVGPHPEDPTRDVLHWYEMCDAVQSETYQIDGIDVSNFVLPLYFTGEDEKGGRNDFLGRSYKGKTLQSFGVNPGGYVGFYDPQKRLSDHYSAKGDVVASKRFEVKKLAKTARRSVRYQRLRTGSG